MQKIQLNKLQLTKGASIQEQEEGSGIFRLSKEGAGFLLPQLMTCEERYLTFRSCPPLWRRLPLFPVL